MDDYKGQKFAEQKDIGDEKDRNTK